MQTPEPNASSSPVAGAVDANWPTLDSLRLRYIHRAIEHLNGNKTRAAELLGIDRRTLNRILARERARKASQP